MGWLNKQDQKYAPAGTYFHQFVVPPIQETRNDCSYGTLASMRLPDDFKGMHACEMTMERRCVHACHAGALVHKLEEWRHHEVGAIDVEQIDVVWNAAARNGFEPGGLSAERSVLAL